jgi:hypothetical protein
MAEPYTVILRSRIPDAELELIEQFSRRMTARTGEKLPYFRCTKINTSHPHYLAIETLRPRGEDEGAYPLQIPHQYVLCIIGDEERPGVGFLADLPMTEDDEPT